MADKKASMVDEILKHFASMQTERQPWENVVEEVLKHVIPGRAGMKVNIDPRTYDIDRESRDGTARASAYLMANGLLGNVCSPKSKWFKLVPELPIHAEVPGFREYLESVENVFYHIFATGNFYSGAWQVFLDAATSGLGSMLMTEDLNEKTVNFQAFAPKGAYIATDAMNEVDTYFHHFTMTARSILEEYPDAQFKEGFERQAKEKPFNRYEIIHAIFPRKDRDIYKLDNINMEYASIHILRSDKTLLRESGYDSFPMSIFRYLYDSEEVYPHSPSIDGFADIQRLEKISKATTDVAQLIARPPMFIPGEMYDTFELTPNFKIKGYDMNRMPHPLQMGQNYPVGKDREEYYQRMVQEHYFTNFFLMLAASEGSQMTATEVLERQGEKATVIGGMTSRLTREFLDPIFDRLFIIASRNKWIPEAPEEVIRMGLEVSIDYIGPLSQAQHRFLKLNGPMSSLQNFMPLLEAYPDMIDLIDSYALGKHILIEGGMPSSILRDEKEYQEIQAQKQQAQQQAQQAEIMEKESKALKNGATAPEQGSPTEALLSAAGQ